VCVRVYLLISTESYFDKLRTEISRESFDCDAYLYRIYLNDENILYLQESDSQN